MTLNPSSVPIVVGKQTTTFAKIRAANPPGALNPDQLAEYDREIWRLCPLVNFDAAVVKAQSRHETGGYTSVVWHDNVNPAGMFKASTADGYITFANGVDAARAQIVQLLEYTGTAKLEPYEYLAPRRAIVKQLGWSGTVETVADLTGKWATDPEYGEKVCQHLEIVRGPVLVDEPTPPVPPATTTKPKFLIVAGHRSAGDPGNPTERSLTGYLAEDYTKALRAAGYTAHWWQRDLDGDDNPTMTSPGGLDTVALGVGRYLAGQGGLTIMLDLHYNGPHSVAHAIVPDVIRADGRQLTTAYSGGSPRDDTAANNTLDVAVGAAIIGEIAKATKLGLFKGRLGTPGLMSETECGVGLDGYRLAMFAATTSSRAKAVRLVIEHGGYSDPAATRDDFTQICAAAAVRGIESAFAITQ